MSGTAGSRLGARHPKLQHALLPDAFSTSTNAFVCRRTSPRAGEQAPPPCNAGLQAGLQSFEEYLDLALARVDALRWKGPEYMDDLRKGFSAAQEMIQVRMCARRLAIFSVLVVYRAA